MPNHLCIEMCITCPRALSRLTQLSLNEGGQLWVENPDGHVYQNIQGIDDLVPGSPYELLVQALLCYVGGVGLRFSSHTWGVPFWVTEQPSLVFQNREPNMESYPHRFGVYSNSHAGSLKVIGF